MSDTCGTCASKTCATDTNEKKEMHNNHDDENDDAILKKNLAKIKHKIVVLSGKGGVGKSTIAALLAWHLIKKDFKVGLMDTDIHGPSIPVIFGLHGERPAFEDDKIIPVNIGDLKIISTAFFLSSETDSVIWRGPMKANLIKQFMKDVNWGELDFLIIDSPPGTGDEPLSVCQMMPDADGAVIVSTPQNVSISDVRRSIDFCRKLKFPIIGIIENMSGFICPHCQKQTDIFKTGGGKKMAELENIPFLGSVPLNPTIMEACDNAKGFAKNTMINSEIFENIINNFENNLKQMEKKQ
jgi:Mrp family chromosome partitioning ATPase